MRRLLYLLPLFALLFCSCSKEDDIDTPSVNEPNYYFKVEEANLQLLSEIFDADSCYFYANNDYTMRELCSKIPADVQYEIFKVDGTFVCSNDNDYDATSTIGSSGGRGMYLHYDFLGTNYYLQANYPDSGTPYYPWDTSICTEGEPLTNVLTANNYWSAGDNEDIARCIHRCYYYTGDLNSDCGPSSRYTRIFYSGRKHGSPMEWISDDDIYNPLIPEQKYNASPITGLRLVYGELSEPIDIKDPETGITWHPALMYFNDEYKYNTLVNYRLGADLNNGAGGDWLYLYYTRDTRTGQKLMIVHPYLAAYSHLHYIGGNDAISGALMGSGLCTWTSETWNVSADDLLNAVADGITNKNMACHYTNTHKRVDFIKLYDQSMKPYSGDIRTKDGKTYTVPANFNRNAKGDDEIFISYSFITPEDESWSKF